MNRTLAPLLLTTTLLGTATAQQPTEAWSLRQPFSVSNCAYGNHPVTGAPVRVGGANNSLGALPHVWEWRSAAWRRHVDPDQPVFGTGTVLATDTQRGELLAFGGSGSQETWLWNGSRWRSHINSPLLAPRTGHAMAFDSARGRVVMFGGITGTTVLNDTWEWDGAQWQVMAPGAPPPARHKHAMTFDAARGKVVLFGGSGTTSAYSTLGDTWEWDGTFWTRRVPATSPPARSMHGMVYDPTRQRVVLTSGIAGVLSSFVDSWEWDGNTWSQTVATGAPTELFTQPCNLVFDPGTGRPVVFPTTQEQIVEYTGAGWQLQAVTAPSPRNNAAMAYDGTRQQTVLFGGGWTSTSFGDTWRWDGQRWQQAILAVAPSPRSLVAMAFDGARGETVLFGGYTYGSSPTPTVYHGDTWTWNGSAWTQHNPTNAPSARMGYALAYHAPSQRVVLFGGGTTNTAHNDTWTWDGVNWTQQSPASSPPARVGAAMVATPSDLVLFGGGVPATGAWTARDDTWLWDGGNWSQRQTANAPSARYYTSMTYDEVADRVLLIGGYPMPTQVVPDVTWSFDGTDWTPLQLAYDPLVRTGASMVRDLARGQTLLFGGARFSAQNDLWVLGPAAEESPFGAGCAGTLGTPQPLPTTNSAATIGGVARADLLHLPLSFAILTVGFSDSMAGSTPLPLSLAAYGMPGCDLLVSPDAALLVVSNNQSAAWQLSIPFTAALADFDLFVQGIALDPPANAAGATTSNGLHYRIGG